MVGEGYQSLVAVLAWRAIMLWELILDNATEICAQGYEHADQLRKETTSESQKDIKGFLIDKISLVK